jgi:hypothetical protein
MQKIQQITTSGSETHLTWVFYLRLTTYVPFTREAQVKIKVYVEMNFEEVLPFLINESTGIIH